MHGIWFARVVAKSEASASGPARHHLRDMDGGATSKGSASRLPVLWTLGMSTRYEPHSNSGGGRYHVAALTVRIDKQLAKGTRIQLSELGIIRTPEYAGRQGMVVGHTKFPNALRILWDHLRTPVAIHRDYLQSLEITDHLGAPPEFPPGVAAMKGPEAASPRRSERDFHLRSIKERQR
jgi:hypothetical protein